MPRAHSNLSPAPKGRKTTAQSKTLGPRSFKNPSPEGAAPVSRGTGRYDYQLPDGWRWTTLGEIADVKGGITLNKTQASEDPISVPYLRVANVQRGYLNLKEIKTVEIPRSRLASYTLLPGDILFNEGGDRDKLGRGWVWNGEIPICCHQNHVFRARPDTDLVDSKFVSYWGNEFGRDYFEREGKQTTNLASINRTKLCGLPIPLPPFPEQRRIVARIDELFSRLDAGVAALRQAKAQLQRYRQSVLAAAVTGQLTQAWREQHPDTEAAEELLKRILIERRSAWKRKTDFKEPASLDQRALPELPEKWCWCTTDQLGQPTEQPVLTGPFGSNIGRKDFIPDGDVHVLTIGCLKQSGIDLSKALLISQEKAEELDRYKLKTGDLMFSRMASVGRAGFVTPDLAGSIFNYHIMRLRLSDAILPGLFVSYVQSSPVVTKYVRDVNHGATRDGINTEQLLSLPVPLAPVAEQYQIVAEVEARTTAIYRLEAELDRQITRSNRLRQSTLSSAFAGLLQA